jgi:hypothetical protein
MWAMIADLVMDFAIRRSSVSGLKGSIRPLLTTAVLKAKAELYPSAAGW